MNKLKKILANREGFLSLLGVLIALVIISMFVSYLLNTYFKVSGVPADKQNILNPSAGINTSNYQSLIDSAHSSVDAINKRQQSQYDEIMKQVK